MSEEFGGRFPSEVLAEVNRLPVGMLEQIIEDRQIARAIAIYEQNPQADGKLVQLVKLVDYEMAAEDIERKKHGE